MESYLITEFLIGLSLWRLIATPYTDSYFIGFSPTTNFCSFNVSFIHDWQLKISRIGWPINGMALTGFMKILSV